MSKPKLKNEKHDRFARLIAGGMKQVASYQKVYNPDGDCRAAASRLAKRPDVVELVKSIQDEEVARIYASMGSNAGSTLAEMGLTPEWCATQFKVVAAKARAAGDFKAATDSIKSLEKLIREDAEKQGGEPSKSSGGPQINIDHMMTILAKFGLSSAPADDDQRQTAKVSEKVPTLARNRALARSAEHD